jgi:hypothetical protein
MRDEQVLNRLIVANRLNQEKISLRSYLVPLTWARNAPRHEESAQKQSA